MSYYPALIRKDADSDFGVEFPDFPGCVTAGHTLQEALAEAEEALRFHVDDMLADGEPIPDPTPLEKVLETADAKNAAAYLVRLLPSKGRAIRVNITLDENLLKEIDAAAGELNMSRSGYLSMAARLLHDPFLARLHQSIPQGGRVIDGLKRMIAGEEKEGRSNKQPPDISQVGISDYEKERQEKKEASRTRKKKHRVH